MTLVLQFGGDQISNPFSGAGNSRNSSMPCVFDGEALDFESALMTDWTSDIGDYDAPADDFSTNTPSDTSELKRKASIICSDAQSPQAKKLRTDQDEAPVSPIQSNILSTSTSSLPPSPLSLDFHQPSSSSTSSPSFLTESSLETSSSSSSSSDGQEDASSSPTEDEDYLPRRRGPQMWNSRQRWKDERKKVLKMSINKLAEIEDPELCLLRSVLINNTIKKLHFDIRNERQAKIRQRQQRMDYFAEKFQPLDVLGDDSASASDPFPSDLDSHPRFDDAPAKSTSSDLYEDSSCDEIFGISEDFLRVTIPDRRVSSPIPSRDDSEMDTKDTATSTDNDVHLATVAPSHVNTSSTCFISSTSSLSSSCDTAVDCASSRFYPVSSTTPSSTLSIHNATATVSATASSSYSVTSSSRRLVGGSQCATQYRTNCDLGVGNGDGIFPPRVPILDSVVYHSLLASLESS